MALVTTILMATGKVGKSAIEELREKYNENQWRIQDFPNGGALFCRKWGGAHPVFR